MAFKMRGKPVIKGTALHKSARSSAIKKAADDHLRQKAAQQAQAQGSGVNPNPPRTNPTGPNNPNNPYGSNSPYALRGRLQDKIRERLNRNVTIGTRMDDEGNEIVTKTVERDKLFGGGRTKRTRDKRHWDIENVAPENRAERTVDPSQQMQKDVREIEKPITSPGWPDMTGPPYPPDPKRPDVVTPGTPVGDFPIEEGKPPKYGWDDPWRPGITNPVMPTDPIVKLPPDMQDQLIEDINDENVDDLTLAQEYGTDALEALGYILIPGYGLVKEGMAMYEQGIPEYMDRFGGVIEGLGEWLFGGDEEGTQSSGSEQAGGNRPPISRHRPTNPDYVRGPIFWDYPTDQSDYWHWNRPGSGVYKKRK